MKLNQYNQGGYEVRNKVKSGMTLVTPLYLNFTPTQNLDVVTKQYVDDNLDTIDAANIIAGTLHLSRLPVFTGDVTSNQGSNVINLSSVSIVSNIYTKVTVNAKGLVTAGSQIEISDIPNIPWSKITINTPTTLEEFGITEAAFKTGDLLTGILVAHADPVNPLHAATKQYVDNLSGLATSGDYLRIGDLIVSSVDTGVTNFLRCNGARVSKIDYSALYTAIGDNYTRKNVGFGSPWKFQSEFNNTSAQSLDAWAIDTPIPANLYNRSAIVTKNKAYIISGQDHNDISMNKIYVANIDALGILGTWSEVTQLPSLFYGKTSVVVVGNYVYLVGGVHNDFVDYPVLTNKVYRLFIKPDGSLELTYEYQNSLPAEIENGFLFAINTKLYLIGGLYNKGVIGNIFYANILPNDAGISEWYTSPSSVPLPENINNSLSLAFITHSRIYLGYHNANSVTACDLYSAPILNNDTIGSWTVDATFPTSITGASFITKADRVYAIGGFGNNLQVRNSVYYATINADGTIGSWTLDTTSELDFGVYLSDVITTSTKVYLIAGVNEEPTQTLTYVFSASWSGGYNNYTNCVNGSVLVEADHFRLPNLSSREKDGKYYYIKYTDS